MTAPSVFTTSRRLAGTRAPDGATPARDYDRVSELEAAAVIVWPGITWGLDDGRCSCSKAYRSGIMQVKVRSGLCLVHIPGRGPLVAPPVPAPPRSAAAAAELRPRTPRAPARWPRAHRPALPPAVLAPVTDADLLRACRDGLPAAPRLYARACREWAERHQQALLAPREREAEEIVLPFVRLLAGAFDDLPARGLS